MTDKNNAKNLVKWLGFPTNFDYRKWPKLGVITGCALGLTFFAALFISAIQFFSAALGASTSPTIHADARNYALIIAALLSIPFVIWRVLIAQKQANIAEQGLITDRLNKAIEQLGAEKTVKYGDSEKTVPNLEVRLGAIYALERLSYDSLRDHIPVMEILSAYIRSASQEATLKLWRSEHTDVQAALSVIGRRSVERIEFERNPQKNGTQNPYQINLKTVRLQNADFKNARLSHIDFTGAMLQEANFDGAQLDHTNFTYANLEESNFNRTTFYNSIPSKGSDESWAVFHTTFVFDSKFTRDFSPPTSMVGQLYGQKMANKANDNAGAITSRDEQHSLWETAIESEFE